MSDYNPGITALSGFTFQMKVFIAELANIKKNQYIGYEIGDDVSVTDTLNNDEWNGEIKDGFYYSLFQVKRTNVNETKALKTLYNWFVILPGEKKSMPYMVRRCGVVCTPWNFCG